MRARPLLIFAGLLSLAPAAGCHSNAPVHPQGGEALPTVAGRPPASFPDAEAARAAFSRQSEDGTFAAALQDAAWLRFLGSPEEVERAHRAYFESGSTTFDVVMRTKDFIQPTRETFLLVDSRGRRLTAVPLRYDSAMARVEDRFESTFTLSFDHVLTADVQWIRLTHRASGATLEWRFPGP